MDRASWASGLRTLVAHARELLLFFRSSTTPATLPEISTTSASTPSSDEDENTDTLLCDPNDNTDSSSDSTDPSTDSYRSDEEDDLDSQTSSPSDPPPSNPSLIEPPRVHISEEKRKMFYDLNLPYPPSTNPLELSQILAFSRELGYKCVALSHTVSMHFNENLGSDAITIPPVDVTVPRSMKLLTRVTFNLHEAIHNPPLIALQAAYDIVALRPLNDRMFHLCCHSYDCALISLDLGVRLPYILKMTTVAVALQRGVRFEICYSAGILGSVDSQANLISGATALIRATRGRGIVISSEAKTALGLRAPMDLANLLITWGLKSPRAREALCEESAKVVELARMKRDTYRGVIDVKNGGESQIDCAMADPEPVEQASVDPASVDPAPVDPRGMKRKPSCALSATDQDEHYMSLTKNQKRKYVKRQRKLAEESKAAELQLNPQGEDNSGATTEQPASEPEDVNGKASDALSTADQDSKPQRLTKTQKRTRAKAAKKLAEKEAKPSKSSSKRRRQREKKELAQAAKAAQEAAKVATFGKILEKAQTAGAAEAFAEVANAAKKEAKASTFRKILEEVEAFGTAEGLAEYSGQGKTSA